MVIFHSYLNIFERITIKKSGFTKEFQDLTKQKSGVLRIGSEFFETRWTPTRIEWGYQLGSIANNISTEFVNGVDPQTSWILIWLWSMVIKPNWKSSSQHKRAIFSSINSAFLGHGCVVKSSPWINPSGFLKQLWYLPGLVNVNKKRTGKIHHFFFWVNHGKSAIFMGHFP